MALKEFVIGKMRSSVIFLTNTPTTNATNEREAVTTGGQNDVYSTLLTTRGELRKANGFRDLIAGVISGKDSYILTCRFQQTLEVSLKVNGKVTVDGNPFTIDSWEKVDQINHIYRFKLNTQTIS